MAVLGQQGSYAPLQGPPAERPGLGFGGGKLATDLTDVFMRCSSG